MLIFLLLVGRGSVEESVIMMNNLKYYQMRICNDEQTLVRLPDITTYYASVDEGKGLGSSWLTWFWWLVYVEAGS